MSAAPRAPLLSTNRRHLSSTEKPCLNRRRKGILVTSEFAFSFHDQMSIIRRAQRRLSYPPSDILELGPRGTDRSWPSLKSRSDAAYSQDGEYPHCHSQSSELWTTRADQAPQCTSCFSECVTHPLS